MSAANPNPQIAAPWRDAGARPLVEIKDLSKKFGEVTAVRHINLRIYPGELFCLLGGSGCGKSTLLRMLAGFETPSEGQILIDGADMSTVPPHRRPTNMMFQSYALFPHMSVLGNVRYGLLRDGMGRGDADARAMDMLRLVKLEPFASRRPHQLSGGQRQRVALARSLVKNPKLLLLDEPLGALDKKLREETQFELIRIQESLGVTFVVVTHDQEEAMTLSSRIGVMDEGEIVQIGEAREIYEFPATRFVAEFIGDVNMFEGEVIEDEPDHILLSTPDFGTIRVGHGVSCTIGQNLHIAIRPEKLEIQPLGAAPPPKKTGGAKGKKVKDDKARASANLVNSAEGIVAEIAYRGNQSIYFVRLDSGRVVRAMRSNRLRDSDDDIHWDDRVMIGWSDVSAVVLAR